MTSILTDEEIETLVLSLGDSRNGEEFSEEEVLIILRWAEEVTIGYQLLKTVLQGSVGINVKDGEPVFEITDKGKEEIEHGMLPQTDLLQ